ncbi:hypothetical protein vBRpoSV10_153 [Ruegeria phage vB_RpoS-V10]|nr:hypothetical protein vBRpoSV10_153 [Ruegeria phage vB_RpoS-V10]
MFDIAVKLDEENKALRKKLDAMRKELVDMSMGDNSTVATCFGYPLDDLLDIIEKHENGN